MGKAGPTVLFAEAAHLHRLMAEGGLRSSFLGVFHGETVFDTVGEAPRGDGLALDVLLRDFPLVALDERLLEHPGPAASTDSSAVRFRDNFLRKIALRRQIRLVVLDADDAVNLRSLERLSTCPVGHAAAPGWRPADVVIVLTRPMTAGIAGAIDALRAAPAVARVYLMNERLQAGRDGLHLAFADHVWPLCVARLLVVRVCLGVEDPPATRPLAPMLAWRTFAWGASASEEDLWEETYLLALRERLLPAIDHAWDEAAESRHRDTMIVLADRAATSLTLPSYEWDDAPEELRHRAMCSIDDAAADALLRSVCASVESAAGEASDAVSRIASSARSAWTQVATVDGITHLRRLAHGRVWPSVDVLRRSEEQHEGWQQLADRSEALRGARAHCASAVEELAVARARYLPFVWRLIVAAVTSCCILQLLLATLLPLRPPSSTLAWSGPAFMGLPIRDGSVGFLVDRSSSMQGKRLDAVKEELGRVIQSLPAGTEFAVVAFGSDTSVMAGSQAGLLIADEPTKRAATEWVNSLTADGNTVAAQGLRDLLGMRPQSIILLTDGEFSDAAAVADVVREAARAGVTRIDTVALYGREGEDSLRRISQETKGTYRYQSFDPFSPPGFDALLGLIMGAALFGAALGVWLPWWMERRAGRRATRALRSEEHRLLQDIAAYADAVARRMRLSAGVWLGRRSNAVGALQRSLARRALAATERAVGRVRPGRRLIQAVRGERSRPESLVAEDRADLARSLDEPLSVAGDTGEAHALAVSLAEQHADELRSAWRSLCERHDTKATGHIPVSAIDGEFYPAVRRCFDSATTSGLGMLAKQRAEMKSPRVLADAFAERLLDDSHRPFLSTPIEARGGRMPVRRFLWVGLDADSVGGQPVCGWLREHISQRVQVVAGTEVNDLGVSALALIQEEICVECVVLGDGGTRFRAEGPDR